MPTSSRVRWLVRCGVLLASVLSGGCALAQQSVAGRDTPSSMLTRYRQMPAVLCVETDAASLAALRNGQQRVVLHVQHQQAAVNYSPTFSVSLVDPASDRRIEIERFSLHADHAERGVKPAAQHVSFKLAGQIPASVRPGLLCLEVAVDLSDDKSGELGGAELTLSTTLERVDP